MNITMQLKRDFYAMYILQELPKNDIRMTLKLTDRQYVTLVKIVKDMDKEVLNLFDYLKELKRQYMICTDNKQRIELLKLMGGMIEKKHKIPTDHPATDKAKSIQELIDGVMHESDEVATD
jgi:uncharacterized tellurite resistance protein B-like protein